MRYPYDAQEWKWRENYTQESNMGHYRLICPTCKTEFTGYTLSCHCSTLLRTVYPTPLEPRSLYGLWRFLDWLPCKTPLDTKAGSITYKSNGLAKELGLKNLYLSFTGYWPERNAQNLTGSFKDLESNPTVAWARENGVNALTIASAGNTARAFGHIANQVGFDVYLLVPESYLDMLWTPEPPTENIHLIAVTGDYFETIEIANEFCETKGIQNEGGAKNVARRDGMGTVMLDAAFTMKRMPNHYFQAIGSGTGAIACWEMASRLQNHGWDGNPILHLSQNAPFVPIYNAWNAGRRQVLPEDMTNAEERINNMHAVVLSNRNPPYSVGGGVYDALSDTHGNVYSISNTEAREAGKLFTSLEEIDILPAAEVAVASLIQALEYNNVSKNDYILLNVTGGGLNRIKEDFGFHRIEPEGYIRDST
ncbi:MAG: cysteate synthase [Candidatus Thorarchaeota archaeon]